MTIYLLDLFGVFVFALSGAMAAERRRMDLLGFVVIALLPALGAAKALSLGHSAVIAVFMGVMTGVVGGIVRDVVCKKSR